MVYRESKYARKETRPREMPEVWGRGYQARGQFHDSRRVWLSFSKVYMMESESKYGNVLCQLVGDDFGPIIAEYGFTWHFI